MNPTPESRTPGSPPDLAVVRRALRAELERHGLRVGSDTASARGELYVLGESDSARALFELSPNAQRAFETMYQGSWSAEMPPRFAVIPSESRDASAYELLEQARIIPLGFTADRGDITFPELERLLREHLRG